MIADVQDLLAYTGKKLENPGLLQPYIDSAQEIVQNFLGYPLEINFVTEYVQGYGGRVLQLKHRPVNLVYSVKDYETGELLYEASRGTGQDYLVENEFARFKNIIFPKNLLEVQYVCGYGLLDFAANIFGGGDASTSDFPFTAFGGGASDFTIFETYSGGAANNIGVIENTLPSVFRQTLLRIAALLLAEADNNIGITSKSFGDSGTRTFINYTNFDKYLLPISKYRLVVI